MGTYKPGDTYDGEFTTHGSSGGVNADSLPTASMSHNLVDDGSVTLTVSNIDTGRYSVTGTIPGGYAVGDKVAIKISATVGGISDKMILEQFVLDIRANDVATNVTANTTAINANTTAITAVNTAVSTVNTNVTSVGTAVGAVQTTSNSIQTVTNKFAFTVTGKVDSNALVVGDKTGYQLASNGLDVISTTDVANDADGRSTFAKMVRALFNRFFNVVNQTATTQTVENDSGTIVSTMSVSDNGITAIKGKSV